VSIGATLAAARRRAGLSLGELSQRTRIRENILQDIEQDDYATCGGDFYARGHIRAFATAVGEDPQPLIDEFDSTWRSAKEITAAEAFSPGMPIRTRERRRVRWTALLAAVVLAVLGFASYKFVSGAGHASRPAAATSPRAPGTPSAPASVPGVQASTALASTGLASPTTASPTPTPTPSATPVAAQALSPASVAAFGPAGTADGDHPGQVAQAVAGDPAMPWVSEWYATANFGDLQSGTGLLLDMGRTVTVTSVRLSLGGAGGAGLQVRTGTRAALAELHPVATSSGAGGTVQLTLATPARARYVLIWFTKLPPDGAGTYQASVYRITVQGQP
jgi:cytoskeletal protein RodZ